jgi:hypothetical protein
MSSDLSHFDFLPKEIADKIIGQLDPLEKILLSRSCRKFSTITPSKYKDNNLLESACKQDSLSVLNWLLDHDLHVNKEIMSVACKYSSFDIVKTAHERNSSNVLYGRVDLAFYLTSNNKIQAKLETIKWLETYNCFVMTSSTFCKAMRGNYLDLITHYLKQGYKLPLHGNLMRNLKSVAMCNLLLDKLNFEKYGHRVRTKEVYQFALSHGYVPKLHQLTVMLEHAVTKHDFDFVNNILKSVDSVRVSQQYSGKLIYLGILNDVILNFLISHKHVRNSPSNLETLYDKLDFLVAKTKPATMMEQLDDIARLAARADNIEIYQWCLTYNLINPQKYFGLATLGRESKILKLLYDPNYNYPYEVCNNLVLTRKCDYLETFWKSHQLINTEKLILLCITSCPVLGTHIRKRELDWFIDHGYWDDEIYEKLVAIGNLDLLKEIYKKTKYQLSDDLIDLAALHQKYLVFKYLRDLGQVISTNTMRMALESGGTEIFYDILDTTIFTQEQKQSLLNYVQENNHSYMSIKMRKKWNC